MEDIKCDKEKLQKIKQIVEKEIEKELISKQNEVTEISEKIKNILRNLDLLKYIVAVNYYDQNNILSSKKNLEDENEEEKVQTQIHPCIKKLMPFRSNYEKSLSDVALSHSYETRNSKKSNLSETSSVDVNQVSAKSNINKKLETDANIRIPQYIPPLPKVEENVSSLLLKRGGGAKECYRIVVGNISKWIPPDTREDNSTHKWMVYIRNKDNSKDIVKQIRKVRYFLHESYKPHDIIDVTSPPFFLTRRGWGEFPVRVQLHFTHPLNKPVDIIHNLKLDMTCSGIQTLGAETVIDLSLHQDFTNIKNASKLDLNSKIHEANVESLKEKQDVFDESLLVSINGMHQSNSIEVQEEKPIHIKEEHEDPHENGKSFVSKLYEINLAINNSRKHMLDRRKAMKIIEIEHNYLKTNARTSDEFPNKFANSVLNNDGKNSSLSDKTLKNGIISESSSQIKSVVKKNQDWFKKVEVRLNKSEEEIFRHLKSDAYKLETDTQSKYCIKMFRKLYLVNISQRAHASKLTSVESLIKWFVQRWPIITKLALDSTYKTIHPYSSPSQDEFFKYNIGKQRSSEWFRAKAIQKILQSLKSVIPIEEEIWSTKQILLWSRFHGYSPLSFKKSSPIDSTEASEVRNKRLKPNESSSDSDEGSWDSKKFKTGDENFFNGLNIVEKKNFKKSRKKDFVKEMIGRHKNYKECSTWSEANDHQRFGANEFRLLRTTYSDPDVEVINVDAEVSSGSSAKKQDDALLMLTTPGDELLFNKFVFDTTRQIGIKVMEEEVVPGVKSDSVSRVLSQCVSSFLEELLRRSFAQAWIRNGDRCPDSLEVNDILATLMEHHCFDIFTNRGLGIPNSEK